MKKSIKLLAMEAVEWANQYAHKTRKSFEINSKMCNVCLYSRISWSIYPTKYAHTVGKESGRNFWLKWDKECIDLLTKEECEDLIITLHKAIVKKVKK